MKAAVSSLLFQCRFKNSDLAEGVSLLTEKGFLDVSAQTIPSARDISPPPEVLQLRVRSVKKQRHLQWTPVKDDESGIIQYIINTDQTELARTPIQYEPPSDMHSPILKIPIAHSYIDTNAANKDYNVLALNGVGLVSGGKEVAPRRVGPARARFQTVEGNEIIVKDFVFVKGKLEQIVDNEGKRVPLAKVGNKGLPNLIIFESLEIKD